ILADSRFRTALSWLEAGRARSETLDTWEDGTCEWVFHHEAWKAWAGAGFVPILWIYGIPGRGKTILAKYVSQHLSTPVVFTHFFRKTSGSVSTRASAVCISILSQALRQHTSKLNSKLDLIIKRHLVPLYNKFSSCEECPFDRLWSVVEAVFEILPEFTIIVDGIDECSDGEGLLQLVGHLESLSQCFNGRGILLSRHNSTYASFLTKSISLEMDRAAVEADIRLFVEREVNRDESLEYLRTAIVDKIATTAQGMFLWAKMMLEYLKAAVTPRMQLDRLERFPPGLGAVYDTFLTETGSTLSKEELSIRRRLFLLTLGAARALSVEEMTIALTLRSSRPPDLKDRLIKPLATIRRLGWPLIDCNQGSIRFIHASVQEFITSHASGLVAIDLTNSIRIGKLESELAMAQLCLNQLAQRINSTRERIDPYLRHNMLSDTIASDPSTGNQVVPRVEAFYNYAASFWHQHIIELGITITPEFAHQVGLFMRSPALILWAEFLYYTKGIFDLGPVVSIRAEIQSWHALLPLHIRSRIAIKSFLIESYEAALGLENFNCGDPLVPMLLLYRVGFLLNLTGEEMARLHGIRKEVAEKVKCLLGPQHTFSLRCAVEFCVEEINSLQFDRAAQVLQSWRLDGLNPSPGTYHSFYVESNYAIAKYHMLELAESIELQTRAAAGLRATLGPMNQETLKSQLFIAYALQAQGQCLEALKIYEYITKSWSALTSIDNVLTMMSQMAASMALFKLGHTEEALRLATEVLANRQRVLGMNNTVAMDSALALVLVYRQKGELESAEAFLELAITIGAGHCAQERLCQVQRFRAMLLRDRGELEAATKILTGLLSEARGTGGMVTSTSSSGGSRLEEVVDGRDLLWARYDLFSLLKRDSSESVALEVFEGLVVPDSDTVRGSEPRPRCQRVKELSAAKDATRILLKERNVKKAKEQLKKEGLRWALDSRYWLLVGGPYIEQ
ncbi:unnamed protein product, partial [Clonostachys rhizophaga]